MWNLNSSRPTSAPASTSSSSSGGFDLMEALLQGLEAEDAAALLSSILWPEEQNDHLQNELQKEQRQNERQNELQNEPLQNLQQPPKFYHHGATAGGKAKSTTAGTTASSSLAAQAQAAVLLQPPLLQPGLLPLLQAPGPAPPSAQASHHISSSSASTASSSSEWLSPASWPSSRRWQNLNVVLPLYIPAGVIVDGLLDSSNNTYIFPDGSTGAQLLFSQTAPVCNIAASCLRLRIAVVHKCPEPMIPAVAETFRQSLQGGGEEEPPLQLPPLCLRATGLLKHKIQLRSTQSLTYRYDTVCTVEDVQRDGATLNAILSRLGRFQKLVNLRAAGGLEVRFSPCKDLKVPVREGAPCPDAMVEANVGGGGAAALTSWSRRFAADGIYATELRLEQDKSPLMVVDPTLAPLMCREICADAAGNLARHVFVAPEEEARRFVPPVAASRSNANSDELLLPPAYAADEGEAALRFMAGKENCHNNNNNTWRGDGGGIPHMARMMPAAPLEHPPQRKQRGGGGGQQQQQQQAVYYGKEEGAAATAASIITSGNNNKQRPPKE